MAKRVPVVVGNVEQGYVIGKTFFRDVNPDSESVYVRGGYALPDRLIDHLLDRGVETIVLIESHRRLTSDISDWLEYGEEATAHWEPEGWTSLTTSSMART